ncbi:MAG: hypothetical protein ACYDH0_04075 [Candidatus Aminicenantales bacterium]
MSFPAIFAAASVKLVARLHNQIIMPSACFVKEVGVKARSDGRGRNEGLIESGIAELAERSIPESGILCKNIDSPVSLPYNSSYMEGNMIWVVLGLLVVIALILVIIGFRSERR